MSHGLLSLVIAGLLTAGLVVAALAGPRVLRAAAPMLMRAPRLAVGLLASGVISWVLTLLAVGPVLAWVISGPDLLPAGAAQVCQQCLAAANPFGGPTFDTGIPVVLLLVVPALAVVLFFASFAGRVRRRHRATLRSASRFHSAGLRRVVAGYDVLLVTDRHPFALSLPRRHGGIVVSTGAVDLLAADELRAVLAHEQAHVRQHHHLIAALVDALTTHLRWVPLLAAAADALGHYLEIAADDHARSEAGTPALASALLVLGEAGRGEDGRSEAGRSEAGRGADAACDAGGVLHALGPDRVRHLVQPVRGYAGVAATMVGISSLLALTALAGAVHVPYVMVVLSGCV